jgi:hypothetical protein
MKRERGDVHKHSISPAMTEEREKEKEKRQEERGREMKGDCRVREGKQRKGW